MISQFNHVCKPKDLLHGSRRAVVHAVNAAGGLRRPACVVRGGSQIAGLEPRHLHGSAQHDRPADNTMFADTLTTLLKQPQMARC